jgi:hypothetical protein
LGECYRLLKILLTCGRSIGILMQRGERLDSGETVSHGTEEICPLGPKFQEELLGELING